MEKMYIDGKEVKMDEALNQMVDPFKEIIENVLKLGMEENIELSNLINAKEATYRVSMKITQIKS